MNTSEFEANYQTYLDELSFMVKPELQYVIEQLRYKNPLDLVNPETQFLIEEHAKGFVWKLFIQATKQK